MKAYYYNYAGREAFEIERYFGPQGHNLDRIDHPADDVRLEELHAVIFVHTKDDEENFWIDTVGKNTNTQYVFISRSPGQLRLLLQFGLANLRICEFSARHFDGVPEMRALLAGIAAGTPDWSLLERREPSQWLVSAYILLLARQKGYVLERAQLGELAHSSDIWLQIGRLSQLNRSAVPADWDQFWAIDGQALHDALEEIKQCLSKSQGSPGSRPLSHLP